MAAPARVLPPEPFDHPEGLFGHPQGLMTLFFTELWERFSYYGMRAILVLFMTTATVSGGLGFDARTAASIYGMYTALVYMAALPGGWIADNFLGQRKAVFIGGSIIMLGHILLALHGLVTFYSGLGCVVIGTGFLKPNISAIVGQLYRQEDARRDAGFSIFYMGINIGAFISPLICGWLAQDPQFRSILEGWGMNPANSWHWGFGAAAVGMFFGLVQYVLTGKSLGQAGMVPGNANNPERIAKAWRVLKQGSIGILVLIAAIAAFAVANPATMTPENINRGFGVLLFATVIGFFANLFLRGDWTPDERHRLITIAVLFVASSIFWGVFEQAGSTLTLFADESTRNVMPIKGEFPSSWWQSANALMIIALAPFFAWLWVTLGKRDPSSPAKFTVGLVFVGLGFLVLAWGATFAGDGARVSAGWLFTVYLLHTIGELCLSPVGLSSMTKLAPARVVGLMMGVWFLSTSVGNYLGGLAASFYEDFALPTLFSVIAISAIAAGVILGFMVKPIARMLARSE